MPIYEYRCESCEHRLEKLQKMSEGDLVDCPECERPHLKRLVSAAAFRLKGSGWYETDFKKDNKRNLAESPGGTAAKTGSEAAGADQKTASADAAVKAGKADTAPVAKTASKE